MWWDPRNQGRKTQLTCGYPSEPDSTHLTSTLTTGPWTSDIISPSLNGLIFLSLLLLLFSPSRVTDTGQKGWKCVETEASQLSSPRPLARTSRGWLDSHSRQQAEPERRPGVGWERKSKQRHETQDETIKAPCHRLVGQYPYLQPWVGEGNSHDDWSLPRRQILRGHQSKHPIIIRAQGRKTQEQQRSMLLPRIF